MKTADNKTKKFLLPLIAVLIILLAIGGFYLLRRTRSAKTPVISKPAATYSGPTAQEKQEVEQNKDKNGGPAQGSDASSTPPATSAKTVKITSARYDSGSKQAVFQTELDGLGWQKCTLTLTQGSQTVTKTADALYQSQFSTCLGFSVPAGDFPSGGSWSAVLSVSNSDGQTYTSAPASITISK